MSYNIHREYPRGEYLIVGKALARSRNLTDAAYAANAVSHNVREPLSGSDTTEEHSVIATRIVLHKRLQIVSRTSDPQTTLIEHMSVDQRRSNIG
jgi:hypothetical protein